MSNPFDYIKRDREEKERQKAQLEEDRKRKEEDKRESHKRAFTNLVDQYDKMVTSLLNSLRDAAYPEASIRQPMAYFSRIGDNPEWCIGYERTISGEGSDSTEFYVHVKVTLEINSNYTPIRFTCWRNGGAKAHSQLSENHLLATLRKLHPAGK